MAIVYRVRLQVLPGPGLIPVPGIACGELDIAELALHRRLPGQGDLDLVGVDAHDRVPSGATSRAISIVTCPPPHPMSMARIPAETRARSSTARLEGQRSRARTASRS